MDLVIVIVIALTVLSGLDAWMWPQPKRQIKRKKGNAQDQ